MGLWYVGKLSSYYFLTIFFSEIVYIDWPTANFNLMIIIKYFESSGTARECIWLCKYPINSKGSLWALDANFVSYIIWHSFQHSNHTYLYQLYLWSRLLWKNKSYTISFDFYIYLRNSLFVPSYCRFLGKKI